MTDSLEKLQEMYDKQEQFKNRIKEERGVEDNEMDCVKAVQHELVEYEHAKEWKWWKDGSDAHKHMEEHHETEEDYRQEEIADVWHFILQEMMVNDDLKIELEQVDQLFEDPACDEIEMNDLVKALRNVITHYESHKIIGQERHMNIHFGSILQILICLTLQEGMGIDELYTQYMDKNEENHDRQDGESTRGEEYASE